MRKIFFITMLIFTLTRCFTEPMYLYDVEKGTVDFLVDWGELEQGVTAGLVGYFYPVEAVSKAGGPIVDTISGGDNKIDLPMAEYQGFIISADTVTFLYRGMDKYATAEVYLKPDPKAPFSIDDSEINYIAQPDSLYVAQLEAFLVSSETSQLQTAIQPELMTVIAILDVPVNGIDGVLKARASLSGMAESVNLSTVKSDISETGSLIFDFEVTGDGLKAGIPYFEIFKSESIRNVLNIQFILKNGEAITSKHIFDITDKITDAVRTGGGNILLDRIEVTGVVGGDVSDWEDVEPVKLFSVNSTSFTFDDVMGPSLPKDLVIISTNPWEIVNKEGDWLRLSAMSGEVGETTVKLSLDGPAPQGTLREASFIIKHGNLTQTIEVIHYGKSFPFPNCYIVAPAGSVQVPIRNVNTFWGDGGDGAIAWKMGAGGTVDPNASAVDNNLILNNQYDVEVIWSDIRTDGISFTQHATYFEVSNIPNTEGNIIVGVKKNNVFLWSWHLWVTNFDPETNPILLPSGSVAMDRNLGAISNTASDVGTLGLLYQWGRKDPFVGTEAIGSDESKFIIYGDYRNTPATEGIDKGTLLKTVNSPHVFYIGNTDVISQGHLSGDKGYNRWGGATSHTNSDPIENKKSLYDPCPDGWRMPWGVDWSRLTNDNFDWTANGRLYTNAGKSSFFPIAGLRIDQTWKLNFVSRSGYYWSGTPSGSADGNHLEIYESGITKLPLIRASGCSVRPVRE